MALTNREAIHLGVIPCETNPKTGELSYLHDPFHSAAKATVGTRSDCLRHVCYDCQHEHHKHQKVRRGVLWE